MKPNEGMNEGRKSKNCPDEDMIGLRKLLYISAADTTLSKSSKVGRESGGSGLGRFELE
jgi:hypothetical protein